MSAVPLPASRFPLPAFRSQVCVITAISPHPRRDDRLVVELDHERLGALTVDLATELGLRSGRRLTDVQVELLSTAVRRTSVLDKALDLLAVRARSTRDLRIRLMRRGGQADDITWVIRRLTLQGFLDDSAYARSLARARMVSGGVSRRGVEAELRRRGIATDVAGSAIDDALREVELDEYAAALAAARKRLQILSSVDPGVRRRRLYGWLSRRGYESEVVARVLQDVLEVGQESDSD